MASYINETVSFALLVFHNSEHKQKRILAVLLLSIITSVFLAWLSAGPVRAEQNALSEQDRPVLRPEPLIRGTLWWLHPALKGWSKDKLEQAIQSQRDIGFEILWICNTPALLNQIKQGRASDRDVLETIYSIADSQGMRVIADLPHVGFYGKVTAEDILAKSTKHIRRYQARYGH